MEDKIIKNLKYKYESDLVVDSILNANKTNSDWLKIIAKIISSRDREYNLKLISGIRNNIKWNAILFVEENINPYNIAPDEQSGIIFFAPDLYYEYYLDNNFVLFDAFYSNISDYFDKKRNFYKLLKNGINDSLYKEELDSLYELVFNENKKKRSNYVRSRKI